jgi:16S rRNA (guanine527-N7)-methyltransferase
MDIIRHYFPDLTHDQIKKFELLMPLYKEWNSKINVISRKDIDQLYERHVLHSLSIAELIRFKENTQILDAGTGGGFPGIPLAIYFPEIQFDLVDSIKKKINVVEVIAEELKLFNVKTRVSRVEDIRQQYDFIVSRAVTRLPEFYKWIHNNISHRSMNDLPNGILYLKGGDMDKELYKLSRKYRLYPISNYFIEEFFETKYIVHIF